MTDYRPIDGGPCVYYQDGIWQVTGFCSRRIGLNHDTRFIYLHRIEYMAGKAPMGGTVVTGVTLSNLPRCYLSEMEILAMAAGAVAKS